MAYHFSHVGVPSSKSHENEIIDGQLKITRQDASFSPLRFEYICLNEGSSIPADIANELHIAYYVDDMNEAIQDMDEVVMQVWFNGCEEIAFARKDTVLIELIHRIQN